MSSVQEIREDIVKINADSNLYIILGENPIVVDCGLRDHKDFIEKNVKKLINPEDVKTVLLTHLHYDHIGCFDLFPNATFYASAECIRCLNESANNTVLDPFIARAFVNTIKLHDLATYSKSDFLVIPTPGHSSGSVALFYKQDVMFSGDTLFHNDITGRVDLPTSVPEKLQESVQRIKNYNYKVLCPGHDY